MKIILLVLFSTVLFSCSTKQETKDAAFWRMKYEALNSFVKRKGLKQESENAVRAYGKAKSEYSFTVFEKAYSLNGKRLVQSDLKAAISKMTGEKKQLINIIAMSNSKHHDLLFLMNELSLGGFKNFNLSTEKILKPVP